PPCHHSLFVHPSLHCTLPHQDLHSFPTRRSSDLCNCKPLVPRQLPRLGDRPDDRLGANGRAVSLQGLWRARGDSRSERGRGLGEDRKSTRLNSSHRTISYAVFCLKKKKSQALSMY